jgi:hypothetical protein
MQSQPVPPLPVVPLRVVFHYEKDKFYVCPTALDRALSCGQRLPLFANQTCEEPVLTVPGAFAQIAQLAAA